MSGWSRNPRCDVNVRTITLRATKRTGISRLRGVESVDTWLRCCITVDRTSRTSLSSHEGILTYQANIYITVSLEVDC